MVTLTADDKRDIARAIRDAERRTSAEIRVHLEPLCAGDALKAAQRTFRRLGMERTEHRGGVLIYVALSSRRFAVIGDRGIHERVGASFWDAARDAMAARFAEGRFKDGILEGVRRAGEALAANFPPRAGDRNELTDEVSGP